MAGETMKTWIAVAIAICLLEVAQGQFFTRIPTTTTTTTAPGVDANGRRRDCRSAGASLAEDRFRGAEAGAAEAQASAMVDADLNRASGANWVQTGCRIRRVTVPITRFFRLGGRRIRCTGDVQIGFCFGFCRSYYYININNNAVSKRCECCQPTRLRVVEQSVVLTCGVCLFYNYQFTSIQPQTCRCQDC